MISPKWTTDYGLFGYFARKASIWPPLNLAILAAIAEKEGHEVRIIDGEAEDVSQSQMIQEVLVWKPDIIGMTIATPFYHIAVELAVGIKLAASHIPIVIGGAHITALREEALDSSFDYGFIGEADYSWPVFLNLYERGKAISGVKGIIYRDNGEVRFPGEAVPVEDLDTVPLPARHLLKMDKYYIGTMRGNKNFTSIMFTRGCPFSCIFCSTQVSGKRLRKKSVRLLIDEIKSVISDFGIRHFYFADDNLTIDRNYTLEMCDLIEQENLNITFDGSTRANLVDEELISRLAKCGLIRLSFGLESVNSEVRRIMRKEVPLDAYEKANKLVNKYDIECLNSVMIGMPGDTAETIQETLDYLRQAREIKQANCSIAMPYPGTELLEMAKRGDHGLKLETDNFASFRRYGSGVLSVGNLSSSDLIKLQNKAFVSIYAAPWRWKPMIKKSGIIGGLLTLSRVIKSLINIASDSLGKNKSSQ
ncbi:B12-binding domain-containing radical SAM protein [Chloroflexota bacterium]